MLPGIALRVTLANIVKTDKALIGNCGEYFVASYLSGLGASVVVERVNAPTKDLTVTFGRRSVTVQVKTGRSCNRVTYKRKSEENYRAPLRPSCRPRKAVGTAAG